MKIKQLFVIILLIFVVGIVGAILARRESSGPKDFNDGQTVSITIGNNQIQAITAVSAERRDQGLSGIDKLEANQGMLFVFDHSDQWSFWMKDTLIPLDVIWIKDNHIVDIQTMAVESNPADPTRNYLPKSEADMALEVPAGTAKNWSIGETVTLSQ